MYQIFSFHKKQK
jgi:hypothetical protein